MGTKNCVIANVALVTFFCLSVFPSCSSQAETSAQLSDPTTDISDTSTMQATDGTTIAFDDFGEQRTVLWFWAPN